MWGVACRVLVLGLLAVEAPARENRIKGRLGGGNWRQPSSALREDETPEGGGLPWKVGKGEVQCAFCL